MNTDTSLEAVIDDPTPEQHLIRAIRGVRELFERSANGKSLDGVFGALRVCGVDVQQDARLCTAVDDTLAFARRCVDEKGFVRSGAARECREELAARWGEITSADTDEGRKWREDWGKLKGEWREFSDALEGGEDLARLRQAQAKLAADVEDMFVAAAAKGVEKAAQVGAEGSVWLWQDLFNAYIPRLLNLIKDIPIPRCGVLLYH